jgi:exopolysaccharide biosynthesis polyprenyl glycosylphosphotransferase
LGSLASPLAWKWIRLATADFTLVGVNWLLIGAVLVPLREIFPDVWLFRFAEGKPISLLGIAILQAALITLIGHNEGLYTARWTTRQAAILGRSVLWATAILCITYGMQGAPWTTCALMCGAGVLHFCALLVWRQQSLRLRHTSLRSDARKVLIIGASAVGRRVAAHLEDQPEAARTVYGFLDNEKRIGDGVIGRVADLARLARTGFVDEVILAAPRDKDLTLWVVREARRLHLDVKIVPELFGFSPAVSEGEQVGGMPVICLHTEKLPTTALMLKRCVDVAGASLALTALSPLLVVIATLIKLDSHGPVFYRAPRVGRKGHLFRCYKFRTMVRNADELKNSLRQDNERSGPFFKVADDPRITRLGRLLRRYSVDELPQLWNVLKGDMSLVGPRPHPVDDYAEYEIGHLARLDMTPGITGLWQVTARRDPSFQRSMALDREYIETWSLISDARILLKTFLAVARGSGQ